MLTDAWPFVGIVESTDYQQNDALAMSLEFFFMTAHTGPQLRAGLWSYSGTGNHYDGGYSSLGIFTHSSPVAVPYAIGQDLSEPDATYEATFRRCT